MGCCGPCSGRARPCSGSSNRLVRRGRAQNEVGEVPQVGEVPAVPVVVAAAATVRVFHVQPQKRDRARYAMSGDERARAREREAKTAR
jgi:hypothetical protein